MTQQEQDMFDEARMNRFHARLSNLASWCEKRCDPKHNTETTLTMLERKVAKLREQGIADPWPTDNRTCRHAMNPGFPDPNTQGEARPPAK